MENLNTEVESKKTCRERKKELWFLERESERDYL